jgi:hypothetical protein
MDRQQAIRDHFRSQHPEAIFLRSPQNDAGFFFAHRPGETELNPTVHVFTLWDRSCGLSDDDFLLMLSGLSEMIRIFYEITDRQLDRWPAEMRAEVWAAIRHQMMSDSPQMEAVLARVFEPV